MDSAADGPLVGSGGEPVYSERAVRVLGVQGSAWNASGRVYPNRRVVSVVLLQVARADYSAWLLLDGNGFCRHLCGPLSFWATAHEGCRRTVWVEVVILGRGEQKTEVDKQLVARVRVLTRSKTGVGYIGLRINVICSDAGWSDSDCQPLERRERLVYP